MAANPSDKDMVIWALQCNHLESTLFALRYLADRGYQHSSLSSLNVESQVIDLADACIRLAAIAAAAEKCAADLQMRPSGHTYDYVAGFRVASMSRSPVGMRAVLPSASCWTPNATTSVSTEPAHWTGGSNPHIGTEGEIQMAANPSDKDMVIWALQCNHLESTLFALRYLADRGYQHSSLPSRYVESQFIDLADACIRLAAIAAAAEKCAADLRARPSGHTYGYFVGFRIASMSRSPVNMRAVVPSASCWTPNVSTLAQN